MLTWMVDDGRWAVVSCGVFLRPCRRKNGRGIRFVPRTWLRKREMWVLQSWRAFGVHVCGCYSFQQSCSESGLVATLWSIWTIPSAFISKFEVEVGGDACGEGLRVRAWTTQLLLPFAVAALWIKMDPPNDLQAL